MTKHIETDYLVVGAGATGMAFTDALIAEDENADVVMVDRRHRPGGHWIDAYPFVRLHQPSANYGVNSRKLGFDRIDSSGPNAGFYERATPHEICDYYSRVLEEDMVPSGRVRFFGMCDYRGNGSDGHRFVSTLTGETTTVTVRRKLVDTMYAEGAIPSRHTPVFEVDDDVRFVSPNDLVDLGEGASGYTVIGAGKTAMDTCNWLIDQGVAADRIRWIRSRDVWTLNRFFMQPLELVGNRTEFSSRFCEGAVEAADATDIFLHLERHGMAMRLDPSITPRVFRGPTLSKVEFDALTQIENVVRRGKVLRVGADRVVLDEGEIPSDRGHVYVDCTASAVKPVPPRPIFEPGRIIPQLTTLESVPWSAATIGYIEAARNNDDEKNALCPPVPLTGELSLDVRAYFVALKVFGVRMEPDVAAWNENCRLNAMRGAMERMDDPQVLSGFTRMMTSMAPALANLERVISQTSTPVGVS